MELKSPYDRRKIIEAYLKEKPHTGFIVIDGCVDLVNDFNDQKESAEYLQWLMTLTSKYNLHALNVLHVNPSQSGFAKARGHLGTMGCQKAETVFKIEKEDDQRSIISAADVRGKGFLDFALEIQGDGLSKLVSISDLPKLESI